MLCISIGFLFGEYRFLRLEVLKTRWNHEILLYCSYLSLVFRLLERKPKRGIIANQWTFKDLKKKLGWCGGWACIFNQFAAVQTTVNIIVSGYVVMVLKVVYL